MEDRRMEKTESVITTPVLRWYINIAKNHAHILYMKTELTMNTVPLHLNS